MSGNRKALLERFSSIKEPQGTRRVDFKGFRLRLNLRIPERMAFGLRVIKLVTGEAKNAFCERVLKEAVDEKLEELRGKHGEAAWEAITRCAEADARKEPGR